MDPRRTRQLERAHRLRASVSVLLAQRAEAPQIVELDRLRRASLESHTRVHVQVRSWLDATTCVIICARPDREGVVTETSLADAVDRALERFEAHAAS